MSHPDFETLKQIRLHLQERLHTVEGFSDLSDYPASKPIHPLFDTIVRQQREMAALLDKSQRQKFKP